MSSMDSTKLLALASQLTEYANQLDENSSSEQQTTRSVGGQQGSNLSRAKLRELCDEVTHMLNGPQEHLMTIAQSHRNEAAIQYAIRFKLPQYVPRAGTISFVDLAKKAGVSYQQCVHVLRLLITCYVFEEPTAGMVAHSAESLLLLEDHIEAMVDYYTNESFRSASRLADAVEEWPGSEEKNHTAFNKAFDTSLPLFDFFEKEPMRASKFRSAMAGMTRSQPLSLQHLVQGFDWGSLPPGATVVDIGGSAGHCAMALAASFPQLRFVVQDLKATINGHLETRVDERQPLGSIEYMMHDFFQPQPLQADVFFLRWILHDWSDELAVRIIRAQVAAMRPSQRLIIMDGILPGPGQAGKVAERKLRMLDMAMMFLTNSKERTLDDWQQLFYAADERLRLVNVVTPSGSALSVMEWRLDEFVMPQCPAL